MTTKTQRKKAENQHDHRFGQPCITCVVDHPEDHRERKRLSPKQRRLMNTDQRKKFWKEQGY